MDAFELHGGLGWSNVAAPLVVNSKLTAPRGIEHTNYAAQCKALEGGDSLFEGEEDEDEVVAPRATLDTTIPEDNKGYKMLLKMGWKVGKGLGRNEDGIIEPVRSGNEEGMRLGLGKQEQDDYYTNAENVQRKRLETEIQADEDDERKERREAQAERDAKIKQEVSEILRTFYCETCHKQYSTAMELEAHLSSYDHHHRKRLVEMRAMEAGRTKNERSKKEQKNAEREMAKLQKQIERATAAQGGGAAPQAPPLPQTAPPPQPPEDGAAAGMGPSSQQEASPPPPPPPPGGFGFSFGLSKLGAAGRGRGLAARGGMAARGGARGGGRIVTAPGPGPGIFGMSDSEEEGQP